MRNAQGGQWFGGERVIIDPEWEVGEQLMKTGYAINGDLIDVFLEDDGAKVLKVMLEREEFVQVGGDEDDLSRNWKGNEAEIRCGKFGELLAQVIGADVGEISLDGRVERCVEWLGGIMVEML